MTLAACAGFSAGCLETAASITSIVAAAAGRAPLAAAAAVTAAYLGLYPLLLLVCALRTCALRNMSIRGYGVYQGCRGHHDELT